MAGTMDFCTLGMFIIDDIYPPPSAPDQTPKLSIPGGAGTYSALGARIISPPPAASRVGWIVDCGSDFPPELRHTIESWDTGVLFRQRDGLTTKGWNGYSANEHRDFKYLTPKIRIAEGDLSRDLLGSKSFHMVCSQERSIDLVRGISARRKYAHPDLAPPIFIYEPSPDCAIPSALQDTFETLQHVDVISPNHSELASLFDRAAERHGDSLNLNIVEDCAEILMEHANTLGRRLAVVVRAGKDGCYVASNGEKGLRIWLPAYHAHNQNRVIDPTGGGNGFLGGFAVALAKTGDLVQAVLEGSVSASFCIEQVGIPVLGHDEEGRETWNGVRAEDRLETLRKICFKRC